VGTYGYFDKDTANRMFVDLEHEAGVTHLYMRGFHGFRRRIVESLVEAAATPQEIQAAGSWIALRTPLEICQRKLNDADRRRSAAEVVIDLAVDPEIELGAQIGTALTQALNAEHLPDADVEEVLRVTEWAMRGSNPRPRACEARALTS
jgi:hypothetical protein